MVFSPYQRFARQRPNGLPISCAAVVDREVIRLFPDFKKAAILIDA